MPAIHVVARAIASLCLFALFAVEAAANAAAPVRAVAVGTHIDWSFQRDGAPARYQSGPVALTIDARPDADSPEHIQPVLTVEMAGFAPVQLEGSLTTASYDHRVTVGEWDAERPFVLFQSYSGGAHCCNEVKLVVPESGRLQLIDLGAWDGSYFDELPRDLDGDGRLDFVFIDNAFLYTFASYAESFAPPQIINAIDGQPADVSSRPGFRPLFEQAMADARGACLRTETRYEGMSQNGACAAYVASAARAGRFDQAWEEMLRAYDPNFEWPLPPGCRSEPVDGQCPEADVIAYDVYPDALRHFLIAQGYIER